MNQPCPATRRAATPFLFLPGAAIGGSDGVVVHAPAVDLSPEADPTDARVTVLAGGNFVVAWAEENDFHFQVYAPDGTPVGGPSPAGLSATDTKPEIAALADGG